MPNKFLSFLEAVGRDFERYVQPLVMLSIPVVSVLNPGVGAAMSLVMGVVLQTEQRFAAAGKQAKTGPQKAAEAVAILAPGVIQLLKSEGIVADQAVVAKMVDDMVSLLNTLPAPKAK